MHVVAILARRFGIPVYFDVSQAVALALISILRLPQENPTPTEEDIRFGMAGNLCRCTGYQNIAKAILAAAIELNSANKATR